MSIDPASALYAVPLAAILAAYGLSRKREAARSLSLKSEAQASGLTEPASLHPVVDPAKCMGCGACVSACPEGRILGLVDGRAELVEPSSCIGHGACATACPFQAISLVFGTETRGIELPVVSPDFETNVPGIFIAGELGGMGLIRNAIEQGRQAIEAIAERGRAGLAKDGLLDVAIIGAGPAGFSASLAAKEKGLSFETFEQDTLGGTVAHFPRGKLVMTAPASLPIVGRVTFREISKEELLGFWEDVQRKTELQINFQERVDRVVPLPGIGFAVETSRGGTYLARSVLLTIGRRGTPRKLEVPGEDKAKVVYRLVDAEQYRNRHILVVGGGDSAIEAALAVSEQPGATVTLSYRGKAFNRCKTKNRLAIEAAIAEGRVEALLESHIEAIDDEGVLIQQNGSTTELSNDVVIVCAGGILPTTFLRSLGIEIETKHGTR